MVISCQAISIYASISDVFGNNYGASVFRIDCLFNSILIGMKNFNSWKCKSDWIPQCWKYNRWDFKRSNISFYGIILEHCLSANHKQWWIIICIILINHDPLSWKDRSFKYAHLASGSINMDMTLVQVERNFICKFESI